MAALLQASDCVVTGSAWTCVAVMLTCLLGLNTRLLALEVWLEVGRRNEGGGFEMYCRRLNNDLWTQMD